MRTFYEPRAAEEEDRRRGRWRGRAILRARAAGGGERDRPVGTSEHTDRASDLLRRERASVVVGTGVA
jgi:hypothetical protein